MGFRAGKERAQQEQEPESERWSHVLGEVVEERRTGRPWWQNLGIFFGWAGGFAVAAAVVATILLLIVDLFSAERLFKPKILSNLIFWSSAILMIIGLISPTTGDTGKLSRRQGERQTESRATRALRRKIRRTYDPWRWRFWAAALLAFGLAALAWKIGEKLIVE